MGCSVNTIKRTLLGLMLCLATNMSLAGNKPEVVSLRNMSLKELINVQVFVGSRRALATDSITLAPVDTFSRDELSQQGSIDMNAMLRTVFPYYNVAIQPNQDESAFIRPANLRNLPPDSTLVLINGKRRHRGAVITFLGSGVADGAQGTDVSPIPILALKQVQVLRDGASAQYGSDAIAGVIDFQLRDDSDVFILSAHTGSTYNGDGQIYRFGAHAGLPLGSDGYVNLTAQWSESDRTERQVQRADAAELSLNNPDIVNPAQTWGAPDIKDDLKLFINTAMALNKSAELYSFANYADRTIESVFYYRTPNGSDRSQRFSNDGGETILIGDTNATNSVNCPVINIVNGNPTTSPGFDQISEGGPLDSECFALSEVFPGGFTPIFGAGITDSSFNLGIRGKLDNGIDYDVSTYWGRSKADYFFINSVNPSFSNSVANSIISPGFNVQTDTSVNIDLSYPVKISLSSDVNIAGGFEWRREEYKVGLGDPESRNPGDLVAQGFRETVDGFAGFSTRASDVFRRDNVAAYIDLEADITERWVLGTALRFEYFDDFGPTTNFKVSTRFSFTENFSLRGTVSSGFRAPTPGQTNSVRTSTIVTSTGVLESGTLSPTDPLAIALAAAIPGVPQPKPLEPEESTGFTLGAIVTMSNIDVAIDFFRIEVDDRITLGSEVPVGATLAAGGVDAKRVQAAIDALTAAGDSSAGSFSGFNFFANSFSTVTQGVDIVANVPVKWGNGNNTLSFAFNHTETEVSNPKLLSEARIFAIENGLPKDRLNVTWTHQRGVRSFLVRGNYYGKIGVTNDIGLGIDSQFDGVYDAKFLVDVKAQFELQKNVTLIAGIHNIFDTMPDKTPQPEHNSGHIYPEESPFGYNGGFYYLQLNLSW